jgi:hypothetical protein
MIDYEPAYSQFWIKTESKNGKIKVFGSSIEGSPTMFIGFYAWLDEYFKHPQPKSYIEIDVDKYDTASSLMIYDFFRKLGRIFKDGIDLQVNWYYDEDDEDMMSEGEDFQDLVKFPFYLVKKHHITTSKR